MTTPLLVAAREAASTGDLDRLRALLAERLQSVDPLPVIEARSWLLLLVEQGAPDEDLDALCAKAEDRAPLDRLREALGAPSDPVEDADEELDLGLRIEEPGRLPEPTIDRFLRFFGGRRDLYARQWFDATRRRGGYHPVREPLRAEEARHHLEGKTTLGQYLLYPDATCAFAVLDLDLSPSALAELRATRGDDASPCDHPDLRGYAQRLIASARALGIALFPEDSGGRGMHLWVFFDTRRPARAARALLSQVLVAAGPQPADVTVEIFPRQEQLGKRGLSSLVKLPLGLHRGTLRRCALLDDALRPIDDPTAALARLATTPDALVDAVIGQRVVPMPLPPRAADDDLADDAPPPPLPTTSSPRSLAERLRAIPEGSEAEAACERVIAGCDALASIVSKAFEKRTLTADEARAITYSLGVVGPRSALARRVLVAAGASTRELDRVEGGLPSPIGCARLRKISGGCRGCPAQGTALPYPTPLLFAVGPVVPAPPLHTTFAPFLADALAVPPPREIRTRLGALEARIARLEEGSLPLPPDETDGDEP